MGDVILIHDDKLSGLNWKLTRVEELIVGNDGLVRAENVQTSNPYHMCLGHPIHAWDEYLSRMCMGIPYTHVQYLAVLCWDNSERLPCLV